MKITWIEMIDIELGMWLLIRKQPVQVKSFKEKEMPGSDCYVEIVAKDENGNEVKYSGYSDEGVQKIERE